MPRPSRAPRSSCSARRGLDSLALAASLTGDDALHVQRRLCEGRAGDVLIAESDGLDLLVVGAHGDGPLRRATVGNVPRTLLAAAACPVVVLPRGGRADRDAKPAALAETWSW